MQIKNLQLKRALRTALLVLLLLVGMESYAERVTPEVARTVAATFLNNNGVRSNQLTDLSERAGFRNLYIFNGEQGFVVMAADDRAKPILGYSLTGRFVTENMPENLRFWLQGYNDEIQYAIDNQMRGSADAAQEWEDLKRGVPDRMVMTTIVEPLIKSTWGQYPGYNDWCPYDEEAEEYTLTGCVATAMAQIMRYWGHPIHGTISHSYSHSDYGWQTVNFAEATYDWTNMPLDEANSEIAKLMYHCGVSVDMDYGVGASSAFDSDVPYALRTYFGYYESVEYEERNQFGNDAGWILRMKAELDAGRPMLYGGQSSDNNAIAEGHAFVCDGYASGDYFHFNWGWWGLLQDAFFTIDDITPDEESNYSFKQDAVFGIQPVVVIGDLKYALCGSTAKVVGHIDGTSASGNLTIPSSVTYTNAFGQTRNYEVVAIGNNAFSGCSGFTGNLTIPNSVTSIGEDAFYGCSGFTGSLTIGDSVTLIGWRAFKNCSGFTTVYYNPTCANTCRYGQPFDGCRGHLVIGNGVEKIPAYMFYEADFVGSLVIPNSVTTIGERAFWYCRGFTGSLTIGNSVTMIGDEAFEDCSGFTGSLTIGNSVTSIGNFAFNDCSGFTGSLTIPNSMTTIGAYAFDDCSGFTGSLTIGNSVTSIGNNAFSGCSGFTGSLTIPNSVTTIGDCAFDDCSGFTGSLTIGNSVTLIGGRAFKNCSGFTTVYYNPTNCNDAGWNTPPFYGCGGSLVIGDNVERIPAGMFYSADFVGSLIIPNSVTTIGEEAFRGCSGFTGSLSFPNSVTSIDDFAFYNCSGLESVHYTGDIAQWCNIEFGGSSSNPIYYAHNLYIDDELLTNLVIPESITEIKNYTFSGCSCLTSLTIPNSVISIGSGAFLDCSGLADLTIPNSVTTIEGSTFSGCSGLTSLTISNSVTSIGSFAFYNCSGLTDLTIPNSVTTIGGSTFSGCSGLTSLTIPNSVISIGNYAFYNCSELTGTLNIGNSVASIGNYAFSNCIGINAIRLQCPAPPTINQYTFSNVDKSIPVFVACGTQETYWAANYWPQFTAISESPYDLIITQNDPYGGEISVVHYADCEDNHCAIFAKNNIGYNFIGWFVNDYFSTDSPYCDFSLIDNVTFEARFERKPDHFITIVTSTSNTWSDPDTWDTGEVPSETSTVGIYKDIIVDVDAEVEQMGVYDDGSITISPDVTLTVTDELESDTATSIIIEDGGQLYHSNDEAMATVKKSIEPYTTNADGWNLISFPLTGDGTVASITNMLSNQYDLYSYDEPTHYWMNQKEENNGFAALEAGQGYLYANIGQAQNYTTIYFPFYTYYKYGLSENLYRASELAEARLDTHPINGLSWYATNAPGYEQNNISIWMANVSDEELTTTSHLTSGMTLVYTGNMTPAIGWNEFAFNENTFAWDGTSNLLISVQRNNGVYNSPVSWQGHEAGFTAMSYNYTDNAAYDATTTTYSMNTSTRRPNIIFNGTTDIRIGDVQYNPITLTFSGEMENGAAMVTVPLSYTETAGNLKGFNLVGNPYVHNVTSYTSTNVAEGCFRLNDVRDNLIVSEISEAHPLKPSEGFFVKATGENSSITFNAQTRSKTDRRGFINLELSSDGKLIDRLIVKNEGEPLEKLSLNENGTKLYAMQGRQEMAIVPCEGNEQAVDFKAAKNGTYTLSVEVENMELDYLHLIDNLTGTDINLLTTSSYTFTAKTTDYISRFRLVFNTNDSTSADSNTFAYYVDGEIRLAVETQNLASLQIVDAMGRVIRYTNAARHVSTSGLAPGLYVLRLIDGEIVKTQKIIIP